MSEVAVVTVVTTDASVQEKGTLAAALTATAAAAKSSQPPAVAPAGWTEELIVFEKKELTAKLGLTLSNVQEEDEHPVVLIVEDGGAVASPACQTRGVLQPGDRIISLEAAMNVQSLRWERDCKSAERATVSMLKKASTVVNITIERDNVESIVSIVKPSKNATLGLGIESNKKWQHPIVREVDPLSSCSGKIKTGDKLLSVDCPTTFAKLDTRHAPAAKTSSAFLREAIGPVTVLVHRMQDDGKRNEHVSSMLDEYHNGSASRSVKTVVGLKRWMTKATRQSHIHEMSATL